MSRGLVVTTPRTPKRRAGRADADDSYAAGVPHGFACECEDCLDHLLSELASSSEQYQWAIYSEWPVDDLNRGDLKR